MNKEIGGFFEIEDISKTTSFEHHKDALPLNLARNALSYLIVSRNIRKLYIPIYLCDSIKKTCEKEKCEYELYRINKSFLPVFDKKLGSNEYLYVVNYYGLLSDKEILQLKHKFERVIVDNVQAFFKKPIEGVDCIYSCRKFFGVPDGAYLYTDSKLNCAIPVDDSSKRMKHLYGRKKDGASNHYEEFVENENSFCELGLREMSPQTHSILRAIDYKKAKKQREKNSLFLNSKLKDYNNLSLKKSFFNGPYCYPFFIEHGKVLRDKLIKSNIYVPTLWPNIDATNDSLEMSLSQNLLPIPCDQRYLRKDMKRIVDIILPKPLTLKYFGNSNSKNKRVVIKELNMSFLKEMHKWHNDDDLYLTLFGKCNHPSIAAERRWISKYFLIDRSNLFRGVIINEKNTPIGAAYLFFDNNIDSKSAELHIFIGEKKYRGLGYGAEAINLLIKYATKKANVSSINLSVFKDNEPALKLYKKCGFSITSIEEKSALKNNEWKDVYKMTYLGKN